MVERYPLCLKKNINAGGRLEISFFTSLPTPFRFLFENFKFKKNRKISKKDSQRSILFSYAF